MTALTPDQRYYRANPTPPRPREWRDSDHCATDDTGIIRALERTNAQLEQHAADLRGENIALRAALTDAQAERDALKARLTSVTEWYEKQLSECGGGA